METENLKDVRLIEAQSEIRILREEWEALDKRLKDCEMTLRYYASPASYKISSRGIETVYQDKVVSDWEASDNSDKTQVAGRRARLYFSRYDGK